MKPIAQKAGQVKSGRSVEWHFGQLDTLLKPWDTSKSPSTNDPVEKLGFRYQMQGAAIRDYERTTGRVRLMDGLDKKPTTIAPFDPDNHVFRDYEDKINRVWSSRLVVEHENFSHRRKHRSTIWVDACNKQNWAWSMDLFWIKKLEAIVTDKHIKFDEAGFLPYLKDKTGLGKRAALMLNINKRAGYITDGMDAAQLWHIISIRKGGGTTTGDTACGDVTRRAAAIRGDAPFHVGGDYAPLAFGQGVETYGIIYGGMHWIHRNASRKPGNELSIDPKSNQPIIPRAEDKGIWVYVRCNGAPVPTTGSPPPYTEWTPPPGAPAFDDMKVRPSSAGGQGGGYSIGNYAAGLNINEYLAAILPAVGSRSDFVFQIGWRLSDFIGAGEEIQLGLTYKVIGPEGTPASEPSIAYKTLTEDDNPASLTDIKILGFKIKDIANGKLQGGFVAIQFFRLGRDVDDTFPGVFKQCGPAQCWLLPSQGQDVKIAGL